MKAISTRMYPSPTATTQAADNQTGRRDNDQRASKRIAAAVAAAVADALGVAHVDMPFKSEKLWEIVQQQQTQQ